MTKYLIVSDLDGTLADTDHYVNETTKSFIREILDQGHIFYIATGRMKSMVENVAKDIDARVGIVGSNGGIIQTDEGFKISHINPQDKMDLYHHLSEEDVPTLFFTDRDILYTHYVPDFFEANPDAQKNIRKIENATKDLESKNIINVLCTARHLEDPEAFLNPVKLDLQKKFNLNITSSNSTNIEIFSKEASKGNAVRKLMQIHNIPQEQVIVFGDGFNDLSMFEVAHTSVAMDNAPEAVKTYATHTTASNGENGVVKFLRGMLK